MLRITLGIVGLGLMSVPGVAFAQLGEDPSMPANSLAHGTRGSSYDNMVMLPDRDTNRSFEAYNHALIFANCAAKASPSTVSKILATDPHSANENGEFNRMAGKLAGCGPQNAPTIASLIRGSLSEGLYKSMSPEAFDASKVTGTADDTDAFMAGEIPRNKLREKNDQVMIDVTNCFAAAEPGKVHAILYSKHGSSEEGKLMDALFPGAPSCAGPSRPTNISKSYLRSFLADSMYRLATSKWQPKFVPAAHAE